jgi:hypothetical protein
MILSQSHPTKIVRKEEKLHLKELIAHRSLTKVANQQQIKIQMPKVTS